ncbi:uncharacterized protein PAC_19853 [Phialocephala subalpina]|uniref:Aminoglycoside phosphotransferase domain-containing protein n=1 Tax=Phialocephala subalpina TaxID=576137 RepID=A0A1L7XXZ8_9HELO|nr:uncharacterized protein PAC_19853 [Phialocephala subalpina]
MDSDSADEISDAQVQQTLKIIQSAPFTPAEHRLLSSFVRDSVSPKATSIYLLRRISKDESSEQCDKHELWRLMTDWKCLVERFRRTIVPSRHQTLSVYGRDRGVCCLTGRSRLWWDVLGWSQTIVTPIIPDDIVDLFGCTEYVCDRPVKILYSNADDVQSNLLELLSVFLTKKQVDHLRLTVSAEPSGFEVCRKYWTLSKHAASAFREGQIQLEPNWNTKRRPDEDLNSSCYYSLWATMPVLIPLPITSKGHALRSGSEVELVTGDPDSAPLPSAFLFAIHRRFCNSLKSLEIDREILSKKSSKISIQWPSRLRKAWSARAFPWARWLWSYFPSQGRVWVYRLLLRIGASMYQKPNFWTQRVPFGLYIKHGQKKLIPKGEAPALQLVENLTNIQAPRLVESLDDGNYTYLVMTRLPGQPLMQELYTMSYPERTALANDLRKCVQQLKKIPNTNEPAICDANGGPVFDYRLPGRLGGPFHSEPEFNDFIITQDRLRDPCHARHHKICFTHADLNPNNILIHAGRLSGVVDFGCAGFFPDYWEYTKAMFGTPGLDSSFPALFEEVFGDSYRDELDAERKLWRVRPTF